VWHSFGACCVLLPSQYSEVSWLLSFSMVMHWPYYLQRPECDVYMCFCYTFTCSQEHKLERPWGMDGGKSACMGCSCWPFAIITLIKVESWYGGCMEWIPSFLSIIAPILDPLWHACWHLSQVMGVVC
jgi:hypothetical protein